MSEYTVHDEEGFARVYDEDEMITIRRGDLRALLDIASNSMDAASGFLRNEEVEILRTNARVLDINPDTVTPTDFLCQYTGLHRWVKTVGIGTPRPDIWICIDCHAPEPFDPDAPRPVGRS